MRGEPKDARASSQRLGLGMEQAQAEEGEVCHPGAAKQRRRVPSECRRTRGSGDQRGEEVLRCGRAARLESGGGDAE